MHNNIIYFLTHAIKIWKYGSYIQWKRKMPCNLVRAIRLHRTEQKNVYIYWQIGMYCVCSDFSTLAYFINHPRSMVLPCNRSNGFHCGKLKRKEKKNPGPTDSLPTELRHELCWKMAHKHWQRKKKNERMEVNEWWRLVVKWPVNTFRLAVQNNSLNFMRQRVYNTTKSCIVSVVIQFRCYCIALWTRRPFFVYLYFGFFSLLCVEFVLSLCRQNGLACIQIRFALRVVKRKNVSFSNCCCLIPFFSYRLLTVLANQSRFSVDWPHPLKQIGDVLLLFINLSCI